MPKLLFIYSKNIRQQLLSSAFLSITFLALILIVVVVKNNIFSFIISFIIIAALGFYLTYLCQFQGLSFTLSITHLQHHCNKGGWSIPWRKIKNIGIASVNHHNWLQPLPWLGIKLISYEPLLDSISFRVASQILMEQRGLLLSGYRYAKNSNYELSEMLFNDDVYIADNGKIYRGLLAMLANRMTYNRELLGYDIFINEDLLDRPLEDFVGLSRRYLAAAPN